MTPAKKLNPNRAYIGRGKPRPHKLQDKTLFHFEGDVGEFAVAFDLHGGGLAGFERGEGVAEFVDGFDLFAIERVDDVAGAEAGVDGEAVGDDGGDEHAG